MSKRDKRAVNAIHHRLMDRFPHAFPKDYDAIRPLKSDIHVDLIQRVPEMDPVMIRRVLANHTHRDGYLLALIHHRGDRRYDLDGQPVGTVTEIERAEAQRLLDASTKRRQDQAKKRRLHTMRQEKRVKQREIERKNREEKARRKAENARIREEAAARKAAQAAQGHLPPPRSRNTPYRKKWSAQKAKPPNATESPSTSGSSPVESPTSPPGDSPPIQPMPKVTYKKKRRIVLPPKD